MSDKPIVGAALCTTINPERLGGGGVSSWNDLTDKPFSESTETIFEWDGDVSNREPFYEEEGNKLYKISDEVPTLTDFNGIKLVGNNGTVVDVAEEDIDYDGYCLYVQVANFFTIVCVTPVDIFEAGVYVAIFDGYEYITKVIKEDIVPLDEKYIPDTIARVEDIPEVPTKISELENDKGFITADDIPASVTSWNDLTDKPFGEGEAIEWKQVGYGRYVPDTSGSITKISTFKLDDGFAAKDKTNYKIEVTTIYGSRLESIVSAKVENVNGSMFYFMSFGSEGDVIYATASNMSNAVSQIDVYFTEPFPTIAYAPLNVYFYEENRVVKPLDEKYIPDTIARTEDILTEDDVNTLINNAISNLPIYNGEVEDE